MKKDNVRVIIIIVLTLTIISFIGYAIFYTIKHKDDGEVLSSGKIQVQFNANGALDILTLPNPLENVTSKTLPETKGTLTEIDFKTLKKLFQTTKKSILALEKDDCEFCADFEPKFIEALEENNATAYKINISKISNDDLINIYNYIDFNGTPTTYIIENGKATHSFSGTSDKETLSAFIEYFYIRSN